MSGRLSNLLPDVIDTHRCFLTCPGPVNAKFGRRVFLVGDSVSTGNPLSPWFSGALIATNLPWAEELHLVVNVLVSPHKL